MIWLIVALLLGGFLLVGAIVADSVERRRSEREVPVRGIDEIDRHVPDYVTQDTVDATSAPQGIETPRGQMLPFGLAHPQLVAARGVSAVEQPRILLVAGAVTTMRQLLATMAGHPALVVVANEISEEVAATLAANRKMLGTEILACEAGPGDLVTLAELTDGEVLSDDDLRAGYVPEHALGRAALFSGDRDRCWVEV